VGQRGGLVDASYPAIQLASQGTQVLLNLSRTLFELHFLNVLAHEDGDGMQIVLRDRQETKYGLPWSRDATYRSLALVIGIHHCP
jgi:hypothetical protein